MLHPRTLRTEGKEGRRKYYSTMETSQINSAHHFFNSLQIWPSQPQKDSTPKNPCPHPFVLPHSHHFFVSIGARFACPACDHPTPSPTFLRLHPGPWPLATKLFQESFERYHNSTCQFFAYMASACPKNYYPHLLYHLESILCRDLRSHEPAQSSQHAICAGTDAMSSKIFKAYMQEHTSLHAKQNVRADTKQCLQSASNTKQCWLSDHRRWFSKALQIPSKTCMCMPDISKLLQILSF